MDLTHYPKVFMNFVSINASVYRLAIRNTTILSLHLVNYIEVKAVINFLYILIMASLRHC